MGKVVIVTEKSTFISKKGILSFTFYFYPLKIYKVYPYYWPQVLELGF